MKTVFQFFLAAVTLAVAFGQPPDFAAAGATAAGCSATAPTTGSAAGATAPNVDALKTYLSLTDAQVTSIEQVSKDAASQIAPLMQQICTAQTSLNDLLTKGTTDAAAVGKLVLQIDSLQKQIKQIQDNVQAKAVGYLTGDQKTKLKTLDDASKLGTTIDEAIALHLIVPATNSPTGGPIGRGPRFARQRPGLL